MDDAVGSTHKVNSFALAQAAVDTIGLPLLVLDKYLRVVAANYFFHAKFKLSRQAVIGRAIYALGDGRWNIPELRPLLEEVLARPATVEPLTAEGEIAGRCTMLFNARKVFYENETDQMILLAMTDVTEERIVKKDMFELLRQKDILLQELQHRVGNSLQIIASILLLKARTAQSEESRIQLQDAHGRVMSIAAVQTQLQASPTSDLVEMGPYLSRLCESIETSMIADTRPISLKLHIGNASYLSSTPSRDAVSIGLIVTELVINALKYAFGENDSDCEIIVSYDSDEAGWSISVSDNGSPKPQNVIAKAKSGLGTNIVESLSHQLGASVEIIHDATGYRTKIRRDAIEQGLSGAGTAGRVRREQSSRAD